LEVAPLIPQTDAERGSFGGGGGGDGGCGLKLGMTPWFRGGVGWKTIGVTVDPPLNGEK